MLTQVSSAQLLPQFNLSLFGLVFTEGFLAFLSPCILPLLPIYLMYLMGDQKGQASRGRLITNTLGFVLGLTIIFVLLGATASGLGRFLAEHKLLLQKISGVIMIIFGLNYLGVVNIALLSRTTRLEANTRDLRFFGSMLFGAAFSIGWTPCLGVFLGSALLLASNANTLYQGSALLFVFSLGLGIPFLLTALLWDRLQGTLGFIKKNFTIIKMISGGLLILVGLLMLFDLFGYYAGVFL